MSVPDKRLAMTLVLGNCSKMILIKTVIGIAIIKPGIPQRNPQNISITNTAITFMENDFPIKMGSKIAPNNTCTPVMLRIKKNKVLVVSNSTKAKMESNITVIKEPTIWTKLMTKAKSPQKIGKLTSKNTQAKPVPIPVSKLTNTLTLIKVFKSLSIFMKVLMEVYFSFKSVLFNNFCTLMDSANQSTTKNAVIRIEVRNFLKKSTVVPIFSFWKNCPKISLFS